ncbi:ATP-binding protein [Streptomyces pseudogriseolus]|uniref:ATP-binding protein n=1 Tax=Streptomyces pseudogriseolus TaxID=36817 RepID=UPI001CE2697C|nr:ATP-binding protein [Streptomyces pseudogriseolus]
MASVIPSAPLGTDAAAAPVGLGATPAAAPSRAAAERRFRFELAAHPGSPAQARRLTRARLTGWSVCEDTCDTAALVVSELVTNAIVHTASSHVVCELHDGDDLLRIAVRDEGCAPGRPRANTRQRPEEEHGRGLLLVDALCRAWGAQEHGPGLLVWAELARTADAPHPADFPVTADAPRADSPRTAGSPRATESPHTAASDPGEPRADLGWGARPKPGPAGGSEDGEDESGDGGAAHPAEQRLRIPAERDGGRA